MAGVAHQVAYKNVSSETNFNIEHESIKDYIDIKTGRLDENKLNQHSLLKEMDDVQKRMLFLALSSFLAQNKFVHLFPENFKTDAVSQMYAKLNQDPKYGSDLALEFGKIITSLKTSQTFEEMKKNIKSPALKNVCHVLSTIISDIKKSEDIKKEHEIVIQDPQLIQILKEKNPLLKPLENNNGLKLSLPKVVDWNFIHSKKKDILNSVTKDLGLEYSSLAVKLSQNDTDVAILKEISDLVDGTYNVTFKTGSEAHAILLLKVEGRFYIWDANHGLLKCNKKDPAQTILSLINTYPPPTEDFGPLASKDNHLLNILAQNPNKSQKLNNSLRTSSRIKLVSIELVLSSSLTNHSF